MKKNKNSASYIYDDIDRFLCHSMNSSEEKKFLDMVSKETKVKDKTILSVLMIKAILNKGKKANSELLNAISRIHQDE